MAIGLNNNKKEEFRHFILIFISFTQLVVILYVSFFIGKVNRKNGYLVKKYYKFTPNIKYNYKAVNINGSIVSGFECNGDTSPQYCSGLLCDTLKHHSVDHYEIWVLTSINRDTICSTNLSQVENEFYANEYNYGFNVIFVCLIVVGNVF